MSERWKDSKQERVTEKRKRERERKKERKRERNKKSGCDVTEESNNKRSIMAINPISRSYLFAIEVVGALCFYKQNL